MPKKIFDIIPPKKEETKEEVSKVISKVTPKAAPAKITYSQRPLKSRYKEVLILLAIVLVCGGVFSYFNFLGIKIEIWPVSDVLSFQEDFIVEAGPPDGEAGPPDGEAGRNGEILTAETSKSEQFSASGKTLKESKAEGVIRVYNNYEFAQTLVASTRFLSIEEKLFRSKKQAYIPADSSLDVGVVADQPGEDYNIGPSTFSLPGLAGSSRYTKVYGKSFSEMKGGARQEVSQVRIEDLEAAKNYLQELARKELQQTLQAKAGEKIFLDKACSYEVLDGSSLALAGTEIDKFNFELKMSGRAIVFEKGVLEDFARQFISSKIEDDKQLLEDTLTINYSVKSVDTESGQLKLALAFSGRVWSEINTASLKKALQGKSLTEVLRFFKEDPQISRTKIKLWPFWLKKIPSSLEKIKIDLKI